MAAKLKKKHVLLASLVLILLVVIGGFWLFSDSLMRRFFTPTDTKFDIGVSLPEVAVDQEDVSVVAEDLSIPWEVAFLPDGDLLVTERTGSLKRIGQNQTTIEIDGVVHIGEGGLLGMAMHPDFEQNRWLYLYLTTREGDGLINRVERYEFSDNALTNRQVILDNIPGARFHDGGRIAFGPDGFLYITTGDALEVDLAQQTDSLAGKILRISDTGAVPADNPFGNEVWSYGHRNPQGLAWDSNEQLWATEHGASAQDELNRIDAGNNYGWPVIEGDQTRSGMESPVVHSGTDETWAPAGMAYYDDSLFFAGLRGESLYEAQIQADGSVELIVHLRSEFGRLRAVSLGPDGFLYITTSNTDDRGTVQPNDDKIIRINPAIFRD